MATHSRKSELYRFLSIFILASLIPIALLPSVLAADLDPSGYQLVTGDKFYILSDSAYTSEDPVRVRFETADYGFNIRNYGGVDIRLYRVPRPLEFLKHQKNLHRPSSRGVYSGEGLSNALSYVWDSWYKKSRLAWQRILSFVARKKAVEKVPDLKQVPPHRYQTQFSMTPQFAPMPGLKLITAFRYPVMDAAPIQPPQMTHMAGSSSNFISPHQGNVYIPLGRQRPGLYLAEAIVGNYRASCLIFVSDSMVLTKVSSHQAMVWSALKKTGKPQAGTKVVLTDGVGILDQGVTGADGTFVSAHEIPEHTYVLGEDAHGGTFVSENFYYDSEVYQPKLYVFTDRPLYHAGDPVHVKVFGRDIEPKGAGEVALPLKPAPLKLTIYDPMGLPVLSRTFRFEGTRGGNTDFKLPDAAEPGGYSMRVRMNGDEYGAAFRVSEFTKPHFQIQIAMDKKNYATNEPVRGKMSLMYLSGQPVAGATVQLEVRSEKLAMNEGSAVYAGAFPVELSEKTLKSDSNGNLSFELPPAKDPSRYVLQVRAMDGAAYRVTARREIMIEGYSSTYAVESDRNLSSPGESVAFRFHAVSVDPTSGASDPRKFVAYRLEDQTSFSGDLDASQGNFQVRFDQPGTYTVRLLDASGIILGSTSHFVQGPDLKAPAGQILLVSDKKEYEIGEKARVLISFPEPVGDALLTLERKDVSMRSLLSRTEGSWISLKKLSPTQWEAKIPVRAEYAPNMVFSVAAVVHGELNFQNKGLLVHKPRVEIAFQPEKAVYRPGERVNVAVQATLDGKPVQADLAVSVVDEMIYVLQPEIAPDIGDFFYHLRRNQVRTSSSQNFYTFDVARSANGSPPSSASSHAERSLKVQERPRRDLTDTALWLPRLRTDASGRAHFQFVMPDSLTRWRMTARAMSNDGSVGQSVGFIASQKNVFLKWSGPKLFREGDEPHVALLAMNLTSNDIATTLRIQGDNLNETKDLQLKPGANPIVLPLGLHHSQDLTLSLMKDGKAMDQLVTQVEFRPQAWPSDHSRTLALDQQQKLVLPKDATKIRLRMVSSASEEFLRVADDLMEYPWGCVEQTSSRLIPLTLALSAMKDGGMDQATYAALENRVSTERMRLIRMAGPGAVFGWWGDMTDGSPFLTGYAYFADWQASRILGIKLPPEHWENLLKVYEKSSAQEPILWQALTLYFARRIGLPVQTMTEGLIASIENSPAPQGGVLLASDSAVMGSRDVFNAQEAGAILLANWLARQEKIKIDPGLNALIAPALKIASQSPSSFLQALALLDQNAAARGGAKDSSFTEQARAILARASMEEPTADRAIALVLLETVLKEGFPAGRRIPALGLEWKRAPGTLLPVYQYEGHSPQGKDIALQLPKATGSVAEVSYESFEPESSPALPLQIHRKLYKLVPGETPTRLNAEEVQPGTPLDNRSLYLDSVELDPTGGPFQYGLLEVPLPPGGEIEGTTWGLKIFGIDGEDGRAGADLQTYKVHEGVLSYSVPIETLQQTVRVNHLVRFSETGKFELPKVRFYRMYQPTAKAYEGDGSAFSTIVVQ